MIAARSHQAVSPSWVSGADNGCAFNNRLLRCSVSLILKCSICGKIVLRTENHISNLFEKHAVGSSISYSQFPSPLPLCLQKNTDESQKAENESVLILVRHGESMWNEKNLFTGCVDVPLTEKGVEEAIEAGKRIRSIPIDIIYTSALIRSQMTAMLALTQHSRMKVPIFMHNESEQAREWSQIYSEATKKQSIPVVKAWQLNERMYGELQGFNKQQTAERYGKEQVHRWRRSYDVRPPNGESLGMCLQRAVTFFESKLDFVP